MKKIYHTSILFFVLLTGITNSLYGQGSIISVAPNMVYPGQSGDIIIRGLGTNFQNGITKVDFGPGITVSSVTVQNTETLDAKISVSKTATANFYDVKVTTGTTVVTMPNGIQIFQAGGSLTATLIVTPVQSLHLSDFDPNNLANAPLLFTVTVFNDATPRDLTATVTISCQKTGELGTARKFLHTTPANAVLSFDNRQFDKYSIATTSNKTIQTAIQTGTLPADIYTYKVVVHDNNSNTDVATADGSNIISNTENKPELISPGNPFYSDPVAVRTKQPFFQWFSQGNNFDFYLFEVKPGQKTAEEVATNRPLYYQQSITSTSLLYPNSAAMMEDGKVYAWQIVANYTGTQGQKPLSSQLFWFTMASSKLLQPPKTLAEIKIDPDQTTIATGETFKFTAKGYDLNNDTLTIKPTWSVVPAEGGIIDEYGNFTAGSNANMVAVIVAVGDIKDYATVTITQNLGNNSGSLGMDNFLKQVFGLPGK